MTTTDPLDYLKLTVTRSTHLALTGRQIMCPRCGSILDARRAVEISCRVICAPCYDKLTASLPEDLKAKIPGCIESGSIVDGRTLWATRSIRARKTRKG